MEIYLIRHTTPDIEKGICYGQSNIDVTTDFEQECTLVHEQLAIASDIHVYSSPLIRCQKLAHTLGINICLDERLMELHFGSWEMRAWTAIDASETEAWMQNYDSEKVPGGESYPELQSRVLSFFWEIISQSHNTNVVVTHAGPIRALVSYLLHMTLKDSFRIQLNYGHVLKLERKGATFAVTKGLVLK